MDCYYPYNTNLETVNCAIEIEKTQKKCIDINSDYLMNKEYLIYNEMTCIFGIQLVLKIK